MLFDKDNQWRFTTIAKRRLEPGNLEGDDALVAAAMDLHPELDAMWDLGELSATPQEVNGTIVNPFIHTALHVLIEKQLLDKSPPEAVETLNVLTVRGADGHGAFHAFAAVSAELYFKSSGRGKSLEEPPYIELLRQLVVSPE